MVSRKRYTAEDAKKVVETPVLETQKEASRFWNIPDDGETHSVRLLEFEGPFYTEGFLRSMGRKLSELGLANKNGPFMSLYLHHDSWTKLDTGNPKVSVGCGSHCEISRNDQLHDVYGKKDAFMDVASFLHEKGIKHAYWGSPTWVFPVIVKGLESEGVKYFCCGQKVFSQILNLVYDCLKDGVNILCPEKGRDLNLAKKKGGSFGTISVGVSFKESSLGLSESEYDELLGTIPEDVTQLFKILPYEEQLFYAKKALAQTHPEYFEEFYSESYTKYLTTGNGHDTSSLYDEMEAEGSSPF